MVRFDCTTAGGLRDAIAQTTRHAVTLDTLPDDVLARLLARVPLADRVSAGRVCKRWRTTFSSNAYAVARRACTEPVWLVMGGKSYYYDSENGRQGSTELSACSVLDVSLRKVAELEPRHSDWAGSAAIPGLGVLVLEGSTTNRPTATAWVYDLQAGSTWRHWADLPTPCYRPRPCALGELIYVDCITGHGDDRQSRLLRFDKQGNLLETIQKPTAIRWPFVDAPVWCAINGHLFVLTRIDDQDSIYRLDSYDPATGEWRRMPDPPIQGFGLEFGATEHAGKLYVIGGNVLLTMGGRKLVADVRVFDGQVWSTGPPLPSPAVCYFAVSAGDRILVVVDNFRMAYVLHDCTWRSYSCDETEFVAFPYVVPLGSPAIAGYSA